MHGTLSKPEWFPDWPGEVCALIGSGPSANAAMVEHLKDRCRVLVINTSFRLAPWADALYACDALWWQWYPEARDFAGLKITQDAKAAKAHGLKHVKLVEENAPDANRLILNRPGIIGRGENGGFQGLNLLLQFGVKTILMLGIDCRGARWHGAHLGRSMPQQRPQTLAGWASIFDAQAPQLKAWGVEVINLSPVGALKAYSKLTIDLVLERLAKRT